MDDTTAPDKGEDRDLFQAFAELALITVNADPPEQTLRRVAALAKHTLTGVEDVSLTLIEHERPRSVVFTGSLAVELDERQYELGFGPCLDAAKTGQTIVVDTSSDVSYPEFARTAARAGVRHVISVGMPISQRSIGGLNIYRTADDGFPAAFLEHAQMFSGYAAVVVNNITSYASANEEVAGLRIAMQSRAVIEQAKGILIARDHCDADQAFDILKRISQNHNVKLHDIAQRIIDTAQKHPSEPCRCAAATGESFVDLDADLACGHRTPSPRGVTSTTTGLAPKVMFLADPSMRPPDRDVLTLGPA